MNSYQRERALTWLINCLLDGEDMLEAIYSLNNEIYLRLWLNGGTRVIGYDIYGNNIFSEPYCDIPSNFLDELESHCRAEGKNEIVSYLDLKIDIHN